jgi:hypothetical protein
MDPDYTMTACPGIPPRSAQFLPTAVSQRLELSSLQSGSTRITSERGMCAAEDIRHHDDWMPKPCQRQQPVLAKKDMATILEQNEADASQALMPSCALDKRPCKDGICNGASANGVGDRVAAACPLAKEGCRQSYSWCSESAMDTDHSDLLQPSHLLHSAISNTSQKEQARNGMPAIVRPGTFASSEVFSRGTNLLNGSRQHVLRTRAPAEPARMSQLQGVVTMVLTGSYATQSLWPRANPRLWVHAAHLTETLCNIQAHKLPTYWQTEGPAGVEHRMHQLWRCCKVHQQHEGRVGYSSRKLQLFHKHLAFVKRELPQVAVHLHIKKAC